MDTKPSKSVQREYLTKSTLMGVFLVVMAGFIVWRLSTGQNLDAIQLSAIDLALLGFATLRLGRLMAYDLITEPLRLPFTRTAPDETGAGDSVEPKGSGVQKALGQLLSCPICSGTWAGAVLVYGLYAWPGPTRVVVTILGVIGIAEVLNALIEALSWSGQQSRTQAGAILKAGRAEPKSSVDMEPLPYEEHAPEERRSVH